MEAHLDSLLQASTKEGILPCIGASILDASGNTLYQKAFGVTDISAANAAPFTPSTTIMIFSCTKLITSLAALQLIEKGKLSLDDLVEKYVPEIKDIQVLDPSNRDSNGTPSVRPMKTKPTVLHLITHTVGFTYDFFDADTLAWKLPTGQTILGYVSEGTWAQFTSPLCSDPGEKYTYGLGIDWLGFVVEAITKTPLNKYLKENIFTPLGMNNTGPSFSTTSDRMILHSRVEEKLVASPDAKPAENPDRHGGGGYLISTLEDYSQLLVTVLNKGTHPKTNAQILSAKTVDEYVFKDFLQAALKNSSDPVAGAADVGKISASLPPASNNGEFLPGIKLGWSCGLMLNLEDVPGGRKAMSGAWAGLANLYYWIDPTAGKTGMVMTNVLPFLDKAAAQVFEQVEAAAYAGGEGGKVKGFLFA
jgi:methyl acetate hydrolase